MTIMPRSRRASSLVSFAARELTVIRRVRQALKQADFCRRAFVRRRRNRPPRKGRRK
jgi:hypothetical protein